MPIDPSMYSAGAVVLDSQATVNMYAQLMAKKQAKDDALNQYFTELPNKINTAGIKDIHLHSEHGGINDDIQKLQSDWRNDADAIKKGGMAQQKWMSKLNAIHAKVNAAKARTAMELEVGKAKFEGKYDPTDDDINILGQLGKSIYDKSSYKQDGVSDYGWGDLSPSVPNYDVNKSFGEATKGMKGGRAYDEKSGRRDPITGLEWISFTDKFSPEQAKSAGANIAAEFNSDKSAKKYWTNRYHNTTPEELADLNATFKKHYAQAPIKLPNGKVIDMSNIDSAEEFAMAAAAKRAENMIVEKGEVPKSDWQAKNQASINKIYIQDSLIRGRDASRSSLRDFDIFGKYGNKIVSKTVTNVVPDKGGKTKTVEITKNIIPATEIDAHDKEFFNANGVKVFPYQGANGQPDYYIVRDDETWEGDGGQVIDRTNVAQAYADKSGKKKPWGDKPKPKQKDSLGIRDK